MGQHTVVVPNAALIAICSIVQGQSNGCYDTLRCTGEAGHGAVRHGNSIEDSIIAALKVCPQHCVSIAVQAVICAGFDVCIHPAVGDNLPDEHLRGGVLYLTTVPVVHLRVAERQNLLDVTSLEVVQLQFPIGRAAGLIGGVGGVILTTERRGVRFDTIRIYTVNGVVGDFTGVEVVTVAVRAVHLIPVTLPSTGLIGGGGHTSGLAHGATAT